MRGSSEGSSGEQEQGEKSGRVEDNRKGRNSYVWLTIQETDGLLSGTLPGTGWGTEPGTRKGEGQEGKVRDKKEG